VKRMKNITRLGHRIIIVECEEKKKEGIDGYPIRNGKSGIILNVNCKGSK